MMRNICVGIITGFATHTTGVRHPWFRAASTQWGDGAVELNLIQAHGIPPTPTTADNFFSREVKHAEVWEFLLACEARRSNVKIGFAVIISKIQSAFYTNLFECSAPLSTLP